MYSIGAVPLETQDSSCVWYLIAPSRLKAPVEWPGKYRPTVINQNGFSSVWL